MYVLKTCFYSNKLFIFSKSILFKPLKGVPMKKLLLVAIAAVITTGNLFGGCGCKTAPAPREPREMRARAVTTKAHCHQCGRTCHKKKCSHCRRRCA